MAVLKRRRRPDPWSLQRAQAKYGWLIPVVALEWVWRWSAYLLSGWAFLEVLEYCGTLSLLIAAVSYFAEGNDRIKQKHYQAWQVINSAQGKGGSGGRIDALEELHRDGVPLVGVDVSDAFLQGVDLNRANLLRANSAALLRGLGSNVAPMWRPPDDERDRPLHSAAGLTAPDSRTVQSACAIVGQWSRCVLAVRSPLAKRSGISRVEVPLKSGD